MFFHKVSSGGTRIKDDFGMGAFGASRTGHTHQGLDVKAAPGERIFCPADGVIKREALPYANDRRFRGVVISGSGAWEGMEIKLFYVDGWIQGDVKAGQPIGTAQDLSIRYPGITNHVHIEVRQRGVLINPSELFGMCF